MFQIRRFRRYGELSCNRWSCWCATVAEEDCVMYVYHDVQRLWWWRWETTFIEQGESVRGLKWEEYLVYRVQSCLNLIMRLITNHVTFIISDKCNIRWFQTVTHQWIDIGGTLTLLVILDPWGFHVRPFDIEDWWSSLMIDTSHLGAQPGSMSWMFGC